MKTLYLNAFSGIAGDMFVGAMLDLGAPLEGVQEAVSALGVDGLSVSVDRVNRSGIDAAKYRVTVPEKDHGRTWADVRDAIEKAELAPRVRERSLGAFRRLFEAEARVHARPVDEIHLHEAGAADALADIVGAMAAVEALGVDEVVASAINVGSGTVTFSHGTYPVPAPAVTAILEGVPITSSGPEVEATTPTGAALVAELAARFGPLPEMTLTATGYGAGDRDSKGFPNVLQAHLGESAASARARVRTVEANLDDCDPRTLPPLLEKLLEEGALDAWITPVQMKKGRPGFQVTALVPEGPGPEGNRIAELLLSETTTLGVRWSGWERLVADREWHPVETPYGEVRVKVGLHGGKIVNAQPEFSDCEAAAARAGVPVKEVLRAALAAWERRKEEER